MIRRTINAGVRFRVAVAAAAVFVLGAGAIALADAQRDIYPEYEPVTVEIQTEALGLSAAEVEELITAPLEANLLNGVPWVDDIRSESVLGLSSVSMVFEEGTSLYRARQAVQERLSQAYALPKVSKPPLMLPPKSSSGRTQMIGLSSSELSLIELSQLARWTIKPRLLGVEGVANVTTFGQRERQLQVQVDPQRLADNDVVMRDVVEAAGNSLWISPLTFLEASTPGAGGFVDTANQRLGVRHVSPIESAGDLSKVALRGKPGVTLADVATVVEDHQPLIGDALVSDGPGLVMVVEKLRGANSVEVTHGVEAALADLSPALRDVVVDTSVYRPADYIAESSDNLRTSTAVGFGLVILLLALVFLQWRAALIAVVVIATSMSAAVLVLLLRGESLNLLVLAGLAVALGVVIDDAVSSTEQIARRGRDHDPGPAEIGAQDPAPLPATAMAGLAALRGPLMYATAFILLPVLPLLFADDLFGYFGRPLAISYALAVLISMVTALTLTPALAALLYGRGGATGTGFRWTAGLAGRYEGVLARLLARPRIPLAIAAVSGVLGLAALPLLDTARLPDLRERHVLVDLEAPAGTSLPQMNEITSRALTDLRAVPGVRNVASHTGRSVQGDQITNVHSAQAWVNLDSDADADAAVSAIGAATASWSGVQTEVHTYQRAALQDADSALEGREGDLVVRVYGYDESELTREANELGATLDKVDGIAELTIALPDSEPALQVQVDLDKAAEYGVKPGDVRRSAAIVLSGIEVGSLYYDQKIFEVIVTGVPAVRENPDDVLNLLVETPTQELVPLRDLADVREISSPSVIVRDGAFRVLDLTATVTGRELESVAADVRDAIAASDFPREYRAELLGDYAEDRDDDLRLLALAGFAAAGMLLLLQACFGSWRLGAAFFLLLPAAISGALAAALLPDGPPELGALAGLLAVLTLAARTGIVLLRRCRELQHLEATVTSVDAPDLVARAARERLLPTLTSLLATALAFSPVLILGDVAGHEVLGPMAVVVLCGLASTAVVILFVAPLLYRPFGARISESEQDLLLFDAEQGGGERDRSGFRPEPALTGNGAGPTGPKAREY